MKTSILHRTVIASVILLTHWFQTEEALADFYPTPSFVAARSFATEARPPQSVVVGDFNGDGTPDLAVATAGNEYPSPRGVLVLLGNGDGSFQPALNYEAGNSPVSIAMGDFNGDGKLDLAVGNAAYSSSPPFASNVSVLLGKGDGTFQTAVSFPTGPESFSVVVADFNGDGRLDLAVANRGLYDLSSGKATIGSVSVLLGKGDGTFEAGVNSPVEFGPRPNWQPWVPWQVYGGGLMAVGDLNGDGKPDLTVVRHASRVVSVLVGKGDGAFLNPIDQTIGSPLAPDSLTLADFNGDGKLDLAVANGDFDYVTVLLGEGNGTFKPAALDLPQDTDRQPLFVTAGDFNGDGKPDLAVATVVSGDGGGVSVLLGNGDGSFRTAANYDVGTMAFALAVDDLNRDGKSDLVVGTISGVSVLLGKGDGSFPTAGKYEAGGFPVSIAMGDFNGDGKLDLAVANWSNSPLFASTVSVLLGNGDGTFQVAVSFPTGPESLSVVAADFNGDGKTDLAVANYGHFVSIGTYTDGSVSVLLGKGDGTFQPSVNYGAGTQPFSIVAGDFNGDGKPDFAVGNQGRYDSSGYNPYPNSGVSVLLGNGNGTFKAAINHDTGEWLRSLTIGDFNGDGNPDIAVANYGHYDQPSGTFTNNGVSVLLGNGGGAFQAAVNYAAGSSPESVAAGDFNGDGKLDLAVAIVDPSSFGRFRGGSVSVLLGEGDGSFKTSVNSGAGEPLLESIVAGEFNGDGKLDLTGTFDNGVSVLVGRGDGSFLPAVEYSENFYFQGYEGDNHQVAAGDFNGDGEPDLATPYSAKVSVLLNAQHSPGTDLAIVRGGNAITLSWPASSTGFVVESTTSLTPVNWRPVVEVPTNNNGRWEVNAKVNGGERYFRLAKP